MHNSSASPIKINPGFSVCLASYLLTTHLSALILLFFLDLDIYLHVLLATLIVLSMIHYWERDLLHLRSKSVIGIDWSTDRGWLIRIKDGSKLRARLCPSSHISRYIVFLHFKVSGHKQHKVIIPGDAIDDVQFRRLKVLLKMGNHFGM